MKKQCASLSRVQSRASGLLSQITSRLSISFISVIATAILARLLTPSEFGQLAVGLAIVSLADAILDGAFALNIVHRSEVDSEYISTAFNISIIFSGLLSLLLFLGADLLESLVEFTNLSVVIQFLSMTLVIKGAGMVSRNLLIREHRLHALSVSAVTGAFVGSIVVSCGLAALGAGIWSLLWGTFVSVLIEVSINTHQACPIIRIRISKAEAREIVGTGSLYTLSQVLNWCTSSGSSLVSARALGVVDFGFYSRGNMLLEQTTGVIGQPLMRVFFPSFSRMRNDLTGAGQLLLKALSLSAFPFAVASIILVLHSKLIVQIVLGSNWDSTVPVCQALFFSLLPRCCYKITESAAFGLGTATLAVKRQAIFAIIVLGAVTVGASWHITGIAIAVAISIWMNYFISFSIAARLVGVSTVPILAAHVMPIVIACCAGGLDLLVSACLMPLGDWASQILGAFAGCFAATLLFFIAPTCLLFVEVANFRQIVVEKIIVRSRPTL